MATGSDAAPGIRITADLTVPESEIRFATSRSSGPGGQNVNKVESRVTLLFDVEGSPSLDAEQKARLGSHLATRINKRGVLRVVSQKHRTQAANRNAALDRFTDLLGGALAVRTPRKKTRVSTAARRRRRQAKEQRSQLKRLRRRPDGDG